MLLGCWLGLGAVLMAGTAASLGLGSPVDLGRPVSVGIAAAVLACWAAGYAIAARLAIVDAVRRARQRDLAGLQRAANLIKLVAMPFFAANFVALTLLAGSATAWFGGSDRAEARPGGIAVALLFVLVTYLVLLPTSAYGLACLILLREDRDVGPAFFVINLVLQLIFVVDVFSTVALVEVARHRLGTIRAPKPAARHLVTAVVLLAPIPAWLWLLRGWFVPADATPGGSFSWLAVITGATVLELLLLVGLPVVPLITFRTAVRDVLLGNLAELQRAARLAKLTAIPMFVQNFVGCVIMVLALTILPVIATRGLIIFALPVLGAFTTLIVVAAVVGTYLMLLTTSIYGIACVALLLRQRQVGPAYGTITVLLQLIFVADIVGVLVVTGRAGRVLAARSRRSVVALDGEQV